MTLIKTGGFAALVCAATYLFGFALLVTLLAPLGFGTAEIDTAAVADFIHGSPGLMLVLNSTIYILNALALVILVVALSAHLRPTAPAWADVTRAIGLVWATLVLGAGMIANVAVERVLTLYPDDPEGAAALWSILHSVELGLGGGNEIAGAVWILCASVAGHRYRLMPKVTSFVGMCTGLAGLATLIPVIGDAAGAIFGIGAIGWFILIGLQLVRA
ncbi:hypothetical protein [Marivita sp. XM-24bin2]|jgi:hypothetical protein|uniref:hypothetical protein n=1 Tax=unclassified Marivita TaxID=2632480 RepID=UPI000D792A15|nr:hypothetical protein [Marivita sp. XM-24bin2]MCR9108904.1 hypothetical protein [Paracoccaceae bacterium]PWL34961.1 MAG: hypothetical protein DCO97_12010 [Marivita sp. XM-24bin2]